MTYFTSPTCTPCKTLLPKVRKLCSENGAALAVVDITDPKGNFVPPTLTSVPSILVGELLLTGQQVNIPTLRKVLN